MNKFKKAVYTNVPRKHDAANYYFLTTLDTFRRFVLRVLCEVFESTLAFSERRHLLHVGLSLIYWVDSTTTNPHAVRTVYVLQIEHWSTFSFS